MNKEKPILFSSPMIRAILAGKKTMTRRVIKPQPKGWTPEIFSDGVTWGWCIDGDQDWHEQIRCPYGARGLKLWVKERWRTVADLDKYSPAQIAEQCLAAEYKRPWMPVEYEDGTRYDWDSDSWTAEGPGRWRSSLHMPRWASRITLEITSVKVERVQEISEEDILAEGVTVDQVAKWTGTPWGDMPELHDAWRVWWNYINKDYAYSRETENAAWVWVIEFRRVR